MSDNYELTIDINRLKDSSEKIKTIDRYISNYNMKKHFIDISNILEDVDKKYKSTFDNEQNELFGLIKANEEIERNIALLNNTIDLALSNNYDVIAKGNYPTATATNMKRNILDSLKAEGIIIPTYPPEQQQTQEKNPLIPEGYNTIPIGLGIAATGISGSIGYVIASEMQQTRKKSNKSKKLHDDGLVVDDYFDDSDPIVPQSNDYEEEYSQKPVMASQEVDYGYHASRNREDKEKFLSMIDED